MISTSFHAIHYGSYTCSHDGNNESKFAHDHDRLPELKLQGNKNARHHSCFFASYRQHAAGSIARLCVFFCCVLMAAMVRTHAHMMETMKRLPCTHQNLHFRSATRRSLVHQMLTTACISTSEILFGETITTDCPSLSCRVTRVPVINSCFFTSFRQHAAGSIARN